MFTESRYFESQGDDSPVVVKVVLVFCGRAGVNNCLFQATQQVAIIPAYFRSIQLDVGRQRVSGHSDTVIPSILCVSFPSFELIRFETACEQR